MSELPIGPGGGQNPCYIYFVRFNDCTKRESFSKLFCIDEFEDFKECKKQMKHVNNINNK